MQNVPKTSAKNWTIHKSDTEVKITCNDVLVLNYSIPTKSLLKNGCKKPLRQTTFRIWFLKEPQTNTGEMYFRNITHQIARSDAVTKLGSSAQVLCLVLFPLETETSTYRSVNSTRWELVGRDLTFEPPSCASIFNVLYYPSRNTTTLTVATSPSFDLVWSCSFNLTSSADPPVGVDTTKCSNDQNKTETCDNTTCCEIVADGKAAKCCNGSVVSDSNATQSNATQSSCCCNVTNPDATADNKTSVVTNTTEDTKTANISISVVDSETANDTDSIEEIETTTIFTHAKITVVSMEMAQPWLIQDKDLIVVCVVTNTDLDVSETKFIWEAKEYNQSTVNGTGLEMTVGEVIDSKRTMTFKIPSHKVTTDTESQFSCSAKVGGMFNVSASGKTGILAYHEHPSSNFAIKTMPHTVQCTIAANIAVGKVEWYKKSAHSSKFSKYGTHPNTVANTQYSSKLDFTAIQEADGGTYYCNITYNKTSVFPGGSIVSKQATLTVVVLGITPNRCIWKLCSGEHCSAGHWATSVKKCSYEISAATGNNRITNTRCGEPNSGCSVSASGLLDGVVNVTGTSSSIHSTGSSMSTFHSHGAKSRITAVGSQAGTTSDSFNNRFNMHCITATAESNTCKLTSSAGFGNSYLCNGSHCELAVSNGYKETMNCYGSFCSLSESSSNDSKGYCHGNNCSITIKDARGGVYNVASGLTGVRIAVDGGDIMDIQTVGKNNHTVITVNSSQSVYTTCLGANCSVSVYNSILSRPSCEGYECSALGHNVSALFSNATLKVRCVGVRCTAKCEASVNCSAQCVGAYCTATCLYNTACSAICNGTNCTATCRTGPTGGSCTVLHLPKESVCDNCLQAPEIWDWQVCRDNFTKCKSCYLAETDLLNLRLYRLGCLDDTPTEEICPENEYIKDCQIHTCQDDLCSRKLLNALMTVYSSDARFLFDLWNHGLLVLVTVLHLLG